MDAIFLVSRGATTQTVGSQRNGVTKMQEIVKDAKAIGAPQELTVAFSSNTEMFDVHF